MEANGCHSIKGASGTVHCAHLCTHLHEWEGPTLCKWHHYFGSAGGEYWYSCGRGVHHSWCDILNFWKLHAGCVLTAISLLFPSPHLFLPLLSPPPPLPSPSPPSPPSLLQGGPPSVLSMLQSAVRGQAVIGEGEEEKECTTCGSVGTDLKRCLACKQVRKMRLKVL